MATSIFKLVMSAETTTGTTSNPAVLEYFYKLSSTITSTITIPAASFTDSTGNTAITSLTTATTNDGYYLLFVNGALQQTSLYTVDSTQVVITQDSSVPASAPITLVVNNFAPSSTSTTTVTT